MWNVHESWNSLAGKMYGEEKKMNNLAVFL